MGIPQFTLDAAAVITNTSAPTLGKFNRYDPTGGTLTVTLPALAALRVGASMGIQHVGSINTVSMTRAGSDLFDDGSTSFTLTVGQAFFLQVVELTAIKYWKIIGQLNLSTAIPTSPTTNVTVPAGFSVYVPDVMEIAAGTAYEIGPGAVLEIG
jgi:hypothetical protein